MRLPQFADLVLLPACTLERISDAPIPNFDSHNNRFRCGEVNIILALNDIGPNDGATMVVPGSHKSNLLHPAFSGSTFVEGGSLDGMEAAVEVELNAGDAVLFVDCIAHGSARRTNPGVRRVLIYRWGPHWKVYQPPADFFGQLIRGATKLVLSPVGSLAN